MDIQALIEIYKDMRNVWTYALDESIAAMEQAEKHRENGDDVKAADAQGADDYFTGQYQGMHSSLYDLRNLLKASGVDLAGMGIDLVGVD